MRDKDDLIDLSEKAELQDEADTEGAMLKELTENRNKDEVEIDTQITNAKKKKKKFSFSGKKNKESNEIVNLGKFDDDNEDFIIVSQKTSKIKNNSMNVVKVTVSIIIFLAGALFLSFLLLNKITNVKVQGGERIPKTNLYYIPTSYVANTSSLNQGDIVIVSDQSEYIPYIMNYKTYKYMARTGDLLTVLNSKGNQKMISAGSVSYIKSK